ncbi:MAG: 50S ribosomal protein L31e [Nanoarchaeota archaeon]
MAEKKETKKEKIEREYIIPLREKCRPVPRYKKTNKAVKSVKEFLARHMKIRDRDLNKIKLDIHLNEFLWARGIKNPPHKVKVKAVKEGDIVNVELVDYTDKLKFKKLRLEKREEKAQTGKKPIIKKEEEMPKEAESSEEGKKKEDEVTKEPEKEGEEKTEEEKKVEEEKKSAVVEEGEEIKKEESKYLKKTTKIKSPEQKKDEIKEPRAK